jgi:hypothetical protein
LSLVSLRKGEVGVVNKRWLALGLAESDRRTFQAEQLDIRNRNKGLKAKYDHGGCVIGIHYVENFCCEGIQDARHLTAIMCIPQRLPGGWLWRRGVQDVDLQMQRSDLTSSHCLNAAWLRKPEPTFLPYSCRG